MSELKELFSNGKSFELFVASYFQANNYYVDSNLKWTEDKEDSSGNIDILELDVLAKLFSISIVETILIECKRGCVFNDLLLFSGVTQLVNADKNILVCVSHNLEELKRVGANVNIQVTSPEELSSTLSTNTNLKTKLLSFYASNNISNLFFDKAVIKSRLRVPGNFSLEEHAAYNSVRRFLAELIGKLWRESDLIKQATKIKSLLDSHKDYVRKIARMLNLTPGNKNSEYYMNKSVLCQAAGFLILKLRVSYMICAIHCAIALSNGNSQSINSVNDACFTSVVNRAKLDLKLASQIPLFIQAFIYIFGGVISRIGSDYTNVAGYLNLTKSDLDKMIKLLKELFKISEPRIQWALIEDMGLLSLKYVPTPLKGQGMKNREILDFSIDDFCFSDQWISSLKPYNFMEE